MNTTTVTTPRLARHQEVLAMAERKPAKKATQQPAKRATKVGGASGIHGRGTRRDQGARPRAEGGNAPRPARGKADGEAEVLAKIAEMQGQDRAMAKRLHAIVKASAPDLSPKTWYGMPAYAKDGKVVCFFQSAEKFKTRVRDGRLQR